MERPFAVAGHHASPVESDEDRIREASELVQEAVVGNWPKEHRQVQEA